MGGASANLFCRSYGPSCPPRLRPAAVITTISEAAGVPRLLLDAARAALASACGGRSASRAGFLDSSDGGPTCDRIAREAHEEVRH